VELFNFKYRDVKSTIGLRQAETAKEGSCVTQAQDETVGASEQWLDAPTESVEGFTRTSFGWLASASLSPGSSP
jgi:hypothetical protein